MYIQGRHIRRIHLVAVHFVLTSATSYVDPPTQGVCVYVTYLFHFCLKWKNPYSFSYFCLNCMHIF